MIILIVRRRHFRSRAVIHVPTYQRKKGHSQLIVLLNNNSNNIVHISRETRVDGKMSKGYVRKGTRLFTRGLTKGSVGDAMPSNISGDKLISSCSVLSLSLSPSVHRSIFSNKSTVVPSDDIEIDRSLFRAFFFARANVAG